MLIVKPLCGFYLPSGSGCFGTQHSSGPLKKISCSVHGWFHKTGSGVLSAGCQEAWSSFVLYTESAFELFAGNPYCAYVANVVLDI